jgi:hypothetical protein
MALITDAPSLSSAPFHTMSFPGASNDPDPAIAAINELDNTRPTINRIASALNTFFIAYLPKLI